MKYTFNDIDNQKLYDNVQVLFIAGQYHIFNNMISDKLREMCVGTIELNKSSELFDEFDIKDSEEETEGKLSNSLDFKEFIAYSKVPPVVGKWFCSVDYSTLSKKEKEQLEVYKKNPSENGVLVIRMYTYKEYAKFLRDRVLLTSQVASIIQTEFPNRAKLINIATDICLQQGVKISKSAAELFVMRMSNKYEEYRDVLDKICMDRRGVSLEYKDMLELLKGVENYILDDFIEQLTVPINSDKIATNRSIYKMEKSMLATMGARDLVTKLKYKIDDVIEMRYIINKGIVPINVKYSVAEAKEKLDDNDRLKKIGDYSFKRLARLASMSSLRDWQFMKLILSNVSGWAPESEYERVIHTLIHRSVLNNNRLLNDIGIINSIENSVDLFNINSLMIDEHGGNWDEQEEDAEQ